MPSFHWPLFLLAPLAFLIPLFVGVLRRKQEDILLPSELCLPTSRKTARLLLVPPIKKLLFGALVIFLSLGAAGPHFQYALERPEEKRNIMLAIDISRSMLTADFGSIFQPVSRLDAVKEVVASFIEERTGDRLGLVIFGSNAFLQAPLTGDTRLVQSLVRNLRVGLAGNGTAIGDGLGLSLKRLKPLDARSRAIVLVTDGANNAGKVDPLQAARIASKLGIVVHTIGIGSSEVNPLVGAPADYDEKMLKEIASLTGGEFFNASDITGLERVYKEIDELEKTRMEDPPVQLHRELGGDFAIAALLCLTLILFLSRFVAPELPV